MFRKTALAAALVAVATTSAFAATQVSGTVTQVDRAMGYVWLEGVKYDVGEDFAAGVSTGNALNLVVYQNGTDLDVLHAGHAGF